jgi:MYXO-CTERM domain-containing protein
MKTLVALCALASTAHATYSIVGADRARKQSGIAVTSCVNFSVAAVSGAAPGFGQVAAQALLNGDGRDQAVTRLQAGEAPAAIITAITSAAFDPMAARRQYAVVDVDGRVAAYTGTQTLAFAGDRQGTIDSLVFSAQGNILTSRMVIDQAAAAFTGGGCDLAERLMRALEAGAQNGEGDSRCRPSRPSSRAYLSVDEAGSAAGSFLAIDTDGGTGDPIPMVRVRYDAWRATHPCPAPIVDMSAPPGGGNPPGCACSLGPSEPAGAWLLAMLALLIVALRRSAY